MSFDSVKNAHHTVDYNHLPHSHNAIKLVELSMQWEQLIGRAACFSQPTLLGIHVGLTIEPLAQPTVTSTPAL